MEVDNLYCVCCYVNVRNIIFSDCLHFVLCSFCMENLEKKECPICKMKINKTITIFAN